MRGDQFKKSQASAKKPKKTTLAEARANLKSMGQPVHSRMDALRRFMAGDRIFAFHEQGGRSHEIRSVEELDNWAPDQLLALPQPAMAEGYSLKKTQVEKYVEPGNPDDYEQDVVVKDTDYQIINNRTGQVVGTASWTTNDFFGPGALKITMKNGATRWLDIWEREKGNPQTAFNRFVKDPKTAKKYKDQTVAEGKKPSISRMYKVGWNHGIEDEYHDEHSNDPEYNRGFEDGLAHAIGPSGLGRSNTKRFAMADESVAEGKSLTKRVKIVKGSDAGKTGWIRQIKHGAFQGAAKRYYVDLDDGTQVNDVPGSSLRLIKDQQSVDEGLGDSGIQEAIVDTVERLFHKNKLSDFGALEAIRQGVKHHFSKPGATAESAIEGITNILDKRMRKSKSDNYVDLSRFKEALRQGVAHQMKKQGVTEDIASTRREVNLKKKIDKGVATPEQKKEYEALKAKNMGKPLPKQSVAEGSFKTYQPQHVKWVVNHGDGHVSEFDPDQDAAAQAKYDAVKGNRGASIYAVDQRGQSIPRGSLRALRRRAAVAEGSDYTPPKLGTVKATLMNAREPTVQVQVFKHNTLRGDSYWVTKEVRKFRTTDQAQAYIDRINKQGMTEGLEDSGYSLKQIDRQKKLHKGGHDPDTGRSWTDEYEIQIKYAIVKNETNEVVGEATWNNMGDYPYFRHLLKVNLKDGAFRLKKQIDTRNFYNEKPTQKGITKAFGKLLSTKKQGVAEGLSAQSQPQETPQQQKVRAAITKGLEIASQYGKDEYQSQPAKRNWFDPKGYASDRLTGIDSIDPDGTVVISLDDGDAAGWVKKLAALGGMPGVKTRQIQPKLMTQGMTEGLPGSLSSSDYMAGATKELDSTNCPTCHGRRAMYRLDSKLHADNKKGAVKVKCPDCRGTGDATKLDHSELG